MTVIDNATSSATEPRLLPGSKVEVRSRFDDRWAHGFEVVHVTETGYQLKRLSDGEQLPVEFDTASVRKESKRDFWWY